jgi:tetratricopeptide (TPR) repeat protein
MSAKHKTKKVSPQKASPKKSTAGKVSVFDSRFVLPFILVLTFLLFLNTLTKSFISLDDPGYVADNPYIKSLSAKGIKDIFTSFYNANYHPFTTLSYAIEYTLFGLNARPYHLINLLIHLLNVMLVFRLIQKIAGRKDVAAITALFFAIHPMHVESVVWISERKDVLYSFFYLAGLNTYLQYVQAGADKRKWYLYTVLLFLFSLLSKSAAVTFPVMLLLFDFYYRRGWQMKVLLEKTPFFLLSLLFGILAILSQKSAGAINADLMPAYSLVQRFFVVCYTLSYYIIKLIWPFNLAVLNYAPAELPVTYYLSPLFLLLIIFLIYKVRLLQRELVFGILFFLIAISLTVQIIPVGYAIVSDRYSYVPYIGLFYIAGHIYAAIRENKFSFSAALRPYLTYMLAGATLFFLVLTFQRNKVWNNSVSLFEEVVEKYPQVAYAHFTLGKNLMDIPDYNRSLAAFNKSVELNPQLPETYFYRGNVYYNQKNYPSALADYQKAVELNPQYIQAIYNVGVCYNTMGNFQQGAESITKAILISPNEYMYQARASSYFNLKKYKEALDDYTAALAIIPQSGEALYNRGATYYKMQQPAKACEDWKQSLALGYTKATEMLNAFCK